MDVIPKSTTAETARTMSQVKFVRLQFFDIICTVLQFFFPL